MDDSPASATAWGTAIADYLRAHPQASDSAEGVARWWLHAPVAQWPRVRQALDALVSQGRRERTTSADGTERYRLPLPAAGTSPP
jgi:hypothetical protein